MSKEMIVEIKRIEVEFVVEYHSLRISISNGRGGKIHYTVEQLMKKTGYQKIEGSAKEYILNDFKETKEHGEIVARIRKTLRG